MIIKKNVNEKTYRAISTNPIAYNPQGVFGRVGADNAIALGTFQIFSSPTYVLHITNLAKTPIKNHKGDEKWPLFLNKQMFRWSAS